MDPDRDPDAGTDEIGHGPSTDPWRSPRFPSRARTALLVLAGVVVGALGWHQLAGSGAAARGPSRPGTTSTGLPIPLLDAQQVCEYVHGGTLQVSFSLVNVGRGPVRVVAVRPDLPLGMLRPTGVDLAPGHCGPGSAATARGGGLPPGASMPVTMSFTLLSPCPQPAPVGAVVDVAGGFPDATVAVPVLPDLGQVAFPGCAARTP